MVDFWRRVFRAPGESIRHGSKEPEEAIVRKNVGLALMLFAGAAVLAGPCLAQDKAVASVWAEFPVKIDGLSQDWPDATFLTDKKSKAEYAFKNDGANLYILFVFKEPQALSTLESSGMTVYYTLDGKKKKGDGLRFLKRQLSAQDLIASLEEKGEVLTEERKAEILKQPGYVFYEGELVKPPKGTAQEVPPGQIDLPTFRDQRQQKVSFFEFRIPLEKVAQIGGLGAKPGQTVTLGFEWGGMTKEMIAVQMTRTAESSTRASAGAASMESSMQGDERVDSGGSSGVRRNPLARKHSFWVSVKLADEGL